MRRICNILVLGVGGNVSQGIIKALRKSGLPLRIYGACISEYSKGLYMCDEGYICPYASDDKFIPWVVGFCNGHSIDMIFTGVEENVIQLAKNEKLLRQSTNAIFISSSYEKLIIGQDKYLTCRFLEESGCNYPKYQLWKDKDGTIEFAKQNGFPIIVKPRNGKGSSGIQIFNSADEINNYGVFGNEEYVLEQCVGDSESEYTVGCYVDKTGKLHQLLPMRRKLNHGTTVWACTVENKRIVEECTKICKAFQPRGPFNIQLRLNDLGNPVCFELNVRFSGTTAIRSHFGFEDVKAMILEYVYGESIENCFRIKSGEVFRYDEEFYLEKSTTEIMQSKGFITDIQQYFFHEED